MEDPSLAPNLSLILDHFNIDEEARLGGGSEAIVYALGDDQVIRVCKSQTPEIVVLRRRELLDELSQSANDLTFQIPFVNELVYVSARPVTIENRLAGEPMDSVLGRNAFDRKQLLRSYLGAAKQLGTLRIEREWYGDLVREEPLRTRSFEEYALARAHDSIRASGSTFKQVRALEIADAIGPAAPAFVHMDYCPANVLISEGEVSAVVDFGTVSIVGDRRIDPIAAACYLDPEITPTATDEDREYCETWLETNELLAMSAPVKLWLAAFWAEARDDVQLTKWCRKVFTELEKRPVSG